MKTLRYRRQKLGLSQLKLAQNSGVSPFRIFKAENGYTKLTHLERKKISTVMKDAAMGLNARGKP